MRRLVTVTERQREEMTAGRGRRRGNEYIGHSDNDNEGTESREEEKYVEQRNEGRVEVLREEQVRGMENKRDSNQSNIL